ncbi:MAG: MFS transporter [Tessaracoccus sp.]
MSTASTAGAAYRRTRVTWVAFGALFAFGILNAALGPVLPYLRAAQGASYVAASLHPVAFAIGVVTAGIHANRSTAPRKPIIIAGLGIAALAGLLLGYGDLIAVTIAAAFLLGLFATVALIRTWAVLADAHNQHRATAMAEGEVYVSLAGIATPILISLCAATFLGWQSFFLIAAAMVTVAVTAVWLTRLPPVLPRDSDHIATPEQSQPVRLSTRRTLITIIAIVGAEWTLTFWAATFLDESVGIQQDTAVALVSVLFAASLLGRLLASRFALRLPTLTVLHLALGCALVGAPILLLAQNAVVATIGLSIAGIGIGATFPLASSLHVGASRRSSDQSMGQVLIVAGLGQIAPLFTGALAQLVGLRAGLLVLPGFLLLAALTSRPRRHDARPAGEENHS